MISEFNKRMGHWIKTTEENRELWSWIDYLSTPENVKNILKDKFERNRFSVNHQELIKKINEQSGLESFSVITPADYDEQAVIISNSVKQAQEYFNAAKHTTPMVSPVLYYYGMVALANALINSTYKYNSPEKNHGLQINDDYKSVIIKKKGIFPRLHNIFSNDLIFNNDAKITLKELFSINPELEKEYMFIYNENPNSHTEKVDFEKGLTQSINNLTINGQNYLLHPIDIHFLTMFILSSFCRYRPREWSDFMGGGSKENFIVKRFLSNAERRFPNLILNEIWSTTFLFAPVARLG